MVTRCFRSFSGFARFWAALLCLAAMPVWASADPAKVALVVGNSAYAHLPGLTTPTNDAQDVADTLRDMGYEVTLLTDIGSPVFRVVLDTFAEQAKQAETVVFYYAGHAFQRDGVNHLVPVGAQPDAAGGVLADTWTLNDIVARLKAGSGQVLIFLDACRTAPLPEIAATGSQGLAQFDGGAGTFVAFATRPGAVAFDRAGGERNSPFTGALLAEMATPGQSISDLMISVRNSVDQMTGGQQVPWDQSSLRAQVFLVPGPVVAALPVFEFAQDATVVGALLEDGAGGAITRVQGDQMRLAAVRSETRSLAAVDAAQDLRIKGVEPVLRVPGVSPGVDGAVTQLPPVPATEKELHAAIQTELKRIGCYTRGIDGDWGRGSQAALERFYAAGKDLPPRPAGSVARPDEAAWRLLLEAPEKTCKPQPVAQATPKKPAAAAKKTQQKPAAAKKKAAPAPAPAAAPEKKGVKCRFMVVAVVCN